MPRSQVHIALLAALTCGCIIDAEHVKTELVQVCSEDVPMVLFAESAELAVATVEVDGVGATVDHPDARASLLSLSLTALAGVEDFRFADGLTLDFVAPGTGLPPAHVAQARSVGGESPWLASGDSTIDLVDYLTADLLQMRLEVSGAIPVDNFAVSFDACLKVEGIAIED